MLRHAGQALIHGSLPRRAGAAAAATVVLAVAVGIVIGVEGPGSSRGAGSPSNASGMATVQRRDLVATDTESGTLSYADPQTIYNRISGTITQLATIGSVVEPGQTLYKVDNSPVILFDGSVPAYRDLSPGVTNGPDVQELNQNLVKLGFGEGQIAVNDTWQVGTTDAVERWQASLGETETGTITLGQAVFLPGPQRITAVDTVLGSTGGSSSAAGAGSGSASSTSFPVTAARTEFVSLTTTASTTPTTPSSTTPKCPSSSGQSTTTPRQPTTTPVPPGCPKPGSGGSHGGKSKGGKSTQSLELKALLALLKAETAALRAGRSSTGGSAAGGGAGGRVSAGGGGGASAGGGGGGASSGGASTGGTGSAGSAGSAQPILQTTSTQLVVSVPLDATKQSEAVVGEPVTVQMPNGTTVNGKITQVSPVAQSSSSGTGSTGGGSGSGSGSGSSSTSTVPITIALSGHTNGTGLDQAAVSVDFVQQTARNVLSVPVTALLATAGGGYSVQEVQQPHRLIPVTPGLFAAGYVQISGAGIYQGLQVTDSQG